MNYIIDETQKYNGIVSIYDVMKETKENEKYYRLYEYTGDNCLITNDVQFPNILNYVKTGLLTEEEMVQALLHE